MSEVPGSRGPVAELFESCSNAGRWGARDERGTLNLIGADVVLRAVQTCTQGAVVTLSRPLVPTAGPASHPGADGIQLRVFQVADGRDACDTQVLTPHGFDLTHLDAVGHSFHNGAAYNGRRMDDVLRPEGLACCGIEAMAGGIVTRAVLLDVLRCRDNVPLAPDEGITDYDLDEAERCSGARVLPGDAVLVRSGVRGPDVGGRRPGLLASAVGWLHEHQVAVYGGDCIERFPGEDPSVPMVLHQVGHVSMGLAILDNVDMEAARIACDEYGRQIFLLVLAALPIAGATGCAVNPLAVF